jgi:hypothetical protein
MPSMPPSLNRKWLLLCSCVALAFTHASLTRGQPALSFKGAYRGPCVSNLSSRDTLIYRVIPAH